MAFKFGFFLYFCSPKSECNYSYIRDEAQKKVRTTQFFKKLYMMNFSLLKKVKTICLTAVALVTLNTVAFAQQKQPIDLPIATELLKQTAKRIEFIENKGQWANKEILFGGASPIGQVVVKKNEIFFVTKDPAIKFNEQKSTSAVQKWAMRFNGQNPNFEVIHGSAFETKRNYMVGDASAYRSNVLAYDEIKLKNIYNNIDLRIYSKENGDIEFDWIVNAGANYKDIDVEFIGTDKVSANENGSLKVPLEFQNINFNIPQTYQINNGIKIQKKFNFSVTDNHVRFTTKDFIDTKLPLIIDPVLNWGIFMDNNTTGYDEYLFGVDYDNSRNVYCVGKTGTALPSTGYFGAYGYDNSFNGSRDVILYKIAANGKTIPFITYFGTTAADNGYAISLSPDKSTVFIGGSVGAAITPAGTPAATAFASAFVGGTYDGFVASFDAATLTTLNYYTLIGSSAGTTVSGTGSSDLNSNEAVYSVVATGNNSFVLGATVEAALTTSSPNPNYMVNAADNSYAGGWEMYVAKFTNYNTLTYGTYVGGAGNDMLNDVQVFNDGSVVFTGETNGNTGFSTLNFAAGSASTGADKDGVVGVIPTGGGSFSTLSKIGGTSDDAFFGVSLNPAQDTIFLTGYTFSNNFPLGTGASAANRFQSTFGGTQDAIICKIPKAGKTGATDPWAATYIGTAGSTIGNTLRNYTSSLLLMFGENQNGGFPTKNLNNGTDSSFYSSTNQGGYDVIFFAVGTDLKTQYFGTYVGGTANDYLGATGLPRGSNQFKVIGDSTIIVGSTLHSQTPSTYKPKFIGLGNGGVAQGITAPLFDTLKSNTSNDSHFIFSWGIKSLTSYDFGDAPVSYGTPRHTIVPNGKLKIGSLIDPEDQHPANPGKRANKDDLTTSDDEDGISGTAISISRLATSYTTGTISVTNNSGSTATLMGWLDINGNGTFDASEYVSTTVASTVSGSTTATLTWPSFTIASGVPDTSALRLRFTTDATVIAAQSPTSIGNFGEIEDYLVLYNCPTITATITPSVTTLCSGTSATLAASASGSTATPYTFTWNNGLTAGTPKTISPTATTVTTTYTYTLTATDTKGCTGTANQVITVNPTPTFTTVAIGTPISTCGGSNGSITISGVVPATGTYTVNYTKTGNAQSLTTTATAGVITISGLGTGTYANFSISLNGCPSTTSGTSLLLSDPTGPTGTLSGPASGCINAALGAYSVTSLSNCSSCTYVWSATNGTAATPTAATTNITFTVGGNQTAQVIITNSGNCSTTLTKTVAVTGIPTISGTTQASCIGSAADVTVNASVSPSATIEYALDGSSTYQTSNIFTAVANGAHTVIARVQGTTCASSSFSFNVNCTCTTVPTASIGGATAICANSSTTLTATITNSTSGTWSITSGGGSLSTTTCSGNGCTTTYTASTTTPAVISFTTNDPDGVGPCAAATTTKSITINPIPAITGATPANTTTCGGSNGSITLTGVTPTTGTYTITYTKNGSAQSTTATASAGSIVIAGLTAGSYSNFVISINGCTSNTLSTIIPVGDPTPPSGTISGPTTACQGVVSSAFSVTSLTNCSGCGYVWSSAGGSATTPTATASTFTFNSTGTQNVQVILTASNGCSSTLIGSTNVSGIPVISGITQGSCVGFASSVTVNASVTPTATLEYSLDGGTFQTSNIFASVANGNHTVRARTQTSNCVSSTFSFSLDCSCTNPASATISGNTVTCSNTPVTLTGTIVNASTGTWSIISGGGALSSVSCAATGCTTVYTPTAGTSGTKVIRFVTDDPDGVGPCNPDTANYSITVNPTPTIGGSSSSNPSTCGGSNGSITLTGITPASGTYTITYSKNSIPQSATVTVSGTSLTITGLSAGTYTNFVITQNNCGSASLAGSITLVDPTAPSGSITGPTSACNGVVTTAYSINNLLNCSSCSYLWSSTGGNATTASASSTTFNFSSLGAQTVNVNITNTTTLCSGSLS
ncbi:MAG: hypothetical protein RI955_522, partial [Bacteroidota bacterium]